MADWYDSAGSIRLCLSCVHKTEQEDSPTEGLASLTDRRILLHPDRMTGGSRYGDRPRCVRRADAFYKPQRRPPLRGKVGLRRILTSIREELLPLTSQSSEHCGVDHAVFR